MPNSFLIAKEGDVGPGGELPGSLLQLVVLKSRALPNHTAVFLIVSGPGVHQEQPSADHIESGDPLRCEWLRVVGQGSP